MKPAQCGNCKFWDRDNLHSEPGIIYAYCFWLSENQDRCAKSVTSVVIEPEDGNDCPVYVERENDKS